MCDRKIAHCRILRLSNGWPCSLYARPKFFGRITEVTAWTCGVWRCPNRLCICIWKVNPRQLSITSTTHTAVGSDFFWYFTSVSVFFTFLTCAFGWKRRNLAKYFGVFECFEKKAFFSRGFLHKSRRFTRDGVKTGAAPRRIILMVLKPCGVRQRLAWEAPAAGS